MTKLIVTIAILVLFLVIGPILTIWALNTLFPALAIPLSLETWAAVIILQAAIKANVTVKK